MTVVSFAVSALPADDGDCLFVDIDGYRIIIDGGRAATGAGPLATLIETLPPRELRKPIDLAVLTHIDNDHISGLLSLLQGTAAAIVEDVWFNGYEHHRGGRIAVKRSPYPPSTPPANGGSTLGVPQAIQFGKLISGAGTSWNRLFDGGAIAIKPRGPLPRIALTADTALVLIGPPTAKLKALFPAWKRQMAALGEEEDTLGRRPPVVPTIALVRELAAQDGSPDRTIPNGASIAFIIEHGCKRTLFAADAHPDDLVAGLERYGGAGRISFDLIKAPHHGSARNNTAAFINKVQSPRWLISTSGQGHGHPDAAAIARIVLSPGENKQIYCNYLSDYTCHWADQQLQDHFGYKMVFGDGLTPLKVVL